MCCLFGILDHHASLSVQQRTKLLSVLATQSEVRGLSWNESTFCNGKRRASPSPRTTGSTRAVSPLRGPICPRWWLCGGAVRSRLQRP